MKRINSTQHARELNRTPAVFAWPYGRVFALSHDNLPRANVINNNYQSSLVFRVKVQVRLMFTLVCVRHTYISHHNK